MPEVERIADTAVQGYEIDRREGDAGLLEGFFRDRADGEKGIVGGESRYTMVLRRVVEMKCASGKDAEILGVGDGEWRGNGAGLEVE